MWVRKEAITKATGQGLSDSPISFTIEFEAMGLTIRLMNTCYPGAISPWRVYHLDVGFDSVAALVVAGEHNYLVSYFDSKENDLLLP